MIRSICDLIDEFVEMQRARCITDVQGAERTSAIDDLPLQVRVKGFSTPFAIDHITVEGSRVIIHCI